ncbi:hypothetical protein HDU86_005943 [Geranomyces michiganensis]|nr:hypothetical protein HDU86_005943 [Geranomyces michiganensis]
MSYQYNQAPPYGAAPPSQQQQYGGAYGQPQQQQNYQAYGQQQYGAPPPPPPGGQYGQQPYGGGGGGGGYQAGGAAAPMYGGGGGRQNLPPQKPPNADPQLWQWYTAVDADRSGQISPPELQQALINGDWSPFSLETVQLMMTLFDADGSGTIGFDEFVSLWKYIEDWKRIFQQFDADRSGRIDRNELRQALAAFGYNISPKIVDLLIRKFARKGAVDITFDAFISCCVTVKGLSDSFARCDTDRDGWVNMSHEMFLELVIGSRQ